MSRQPPSMVLLEPDTLRELTEHPLRMLPNALRGEVLALWAAHRHLVGLESPMSLAAMLSIWMRRSGLLTEDAVLCCRRLLDPEQMQSHRFASDLTTTLATAVAEVIRARKRDEAMLQRRDVSTPDPEAQKVLDQLLESFASRGLFDSQKLPD